VSKIHLRPTNKSLKFSNASQVLAQFTDMGKKRDNLLQNIRSTLWSIILTQEQEKFIQAKLQTGRYRTAQEILELAFRLLDEYQ